MQSQIHSRPVKWIMGHARSVLTMMLMACFSSIGQSQDCQWTCDSLAASFQVGSEEACEVQFELDLGMSIPADSLGSINWILDGVSVGNDSLLILSSETVQSSGLLTLEISTPNSTCTCSYSESVGELMSEYNWPCECQPFGPPIADFNFSGTENCGGAVQFINASSGAGLSYAWSFGSGAEFGNSNEFNPQVAFVISGGGISNVSVELMVTDEFGCTDVHSEVLTILETPDPGFSMAIPLCTGGGSWPVNYNIYNPNPLFFEQNELTSMVIDWGNGDVDSLLAMSIPFSTEYSSYGYYPITFTAWGLNGCSHVASDDLFVGNNPEIGSANPGNTTGLCVPEALTFPINNFAANDPATMYTVDFGDGTTATFNHPPPSAVTHEYTISSCGANEGAVENAFVFTVTANNECSSSYASVAPIQVILTEEPVLSGPTLLCEESWGVFEVSGGYTNPTNLDCSGMAASGTWSISPLSGQANSNPPFGIGAEISTFFGAPGLYLISYEDYDWLQDIAPCSYDPVDSLELCVMSLPNEIEIVSSSTVNCVPANVQLSADLEDPLCGSYNYEWSVQGGAYEWAQDSDPFAAAPHIDFLESGIYQVELTVSVPGSTNCALESNTLIITVGNHPSVVLEEDVEICEFDEWNASVFVNPGNAVITAFNWTVDGELVQSGLPSPYDAAYNQSGTFELVAQAVNACGSDSDTMFVQVQPLPVVEVIHDYNFVCEGSTVEFTAAGADSYVWNSTSELIDGGSGNDFAVYFNQGGVSGGVTGSTEYNVVTCSSNAGFAINTFFVPGINISGESQGCVGDTVQLNAQITNYGWPVSVEWMQDGDFIGSGIQIGIPADSATTMPLEIQGIITFDPHPVFLQPGGCHDTAFASIQVFPLPMVEAPQFLEFCDQPIAEELPTGYPANGTWIGPGVEDNFFNPATTGQGVFPLLYGFTDSNGCTASDTSWAEVSEIILISAGTDSVLCESNDLAVVSGVDLAENAYWSGPALLDSAIGTVDVGALSLGANQWIYHAGLGSCAITDTVVWNILESPIVFLSTNGAVHCDGDTVWFDVYAGGGDLSSGGDYEYLWSENVQFNGSEEVFWISSVEVGFTSVSVEVIDEAGCSDSYSAFVTPVPLPQIVMPSSVVTCLADFDYSLPTPAPANGTWSGPGITDSSGVFNPLQAGLGSWNVAYSVVGSTGCPNTDYMEVEVIAAPSIDAGSDLAVCEGSSAIMLTGYLPEIGGWWEGVGIDDASIAAWDASGLEPGFYTVYYHHGTGSCESIDSLQIEVRPLPTVSLTSSNLEVCLGDSVSWMVNATGGTAIDSGDYQFEWNATGIDLVSSGFSAFGLASSGGEMNVEVHVTDALGCTNSASEAATVHALPELSLPDSLFACNQNLVESLPAVWLEGGTWSGPGVDSSSAVFQPASVGLGQWLIEYEAMDENGCWGLDSLVMVVQEPVAFDLGADVHFCEQSDWVNLEEPDGLSGVWTGEYVMNQEEGIVEANLWSAGSYVYIFQFGQSSCAVQDSLILEVHPSPEILWDSNSMVCPDSVLTISVDITSATDSILIIWTVDGVQLDDTIPSIDFSWSEAGNQDVLATAIDEWGCSTSSSFSIEVPELPEVHAGDNMTICDQPVAEVIASFEPALSGPLGAGWFYGIGTLPGAIETSGIIHPDALGIGDYQVVYEFTDAYSGCINRDTIDIQVVAPVIIEVGADLTSCANEGPVNLVELNSTSTSLWSSLSLVAPSIWLDSLDGIIDISQLDPGNYSFELSAGTGSCSSSDTMVVTVQPAPTAVVTGEDSFCFGEEDATLSVATPVGGTWMGMGVMDATLGTFDASLSPDIYELSYIFVDAASGCTDTAWQQVAILSLPDVHAGADLTICNEPIPFQLEQPSPSFNESGVGYFLGLDNAITAVSEDGWMDPSVLSPGAHSVAYIYTDAVTGCTQSDTLVLEVNESFAISAGPDSSVCANSGLLFLQGQNSTTGVSWTSSTSGGEAAIVDDVIGVIDVSLLFPGEYDFILSTGAGTCEVSDSRTIHVQALPEIELVSQSAFCGNSGLVSLPIPTPVGGIWFGDGIVDSELGTFEMNPSNSEGTVFYAYSDPATLCADTMTHAVVALEVPTAEFVSPIVNCVGAPLSIEQTSSGAIDFEWWLNDSLISNANEPAFVHDALGWFSLSLVAINSFGCLDTTAVSLEWIDAPVAAFTVSEDEGCAPLFIETLDASSGVYAEWTWSIDGMAVDASAASSFEFMSGADVETHEIALTVENACGISEHAEEITVLPLPQMAFSFLEDSVCSPYTANILNASLGNPEVLNWDFGNGETASGWAPIMPTYAVDENPAWFEVTLSGSNACGVDTAQGSIWVEPNTTVAFFNLSTQSGCAPLEVVAWDLSVEGTSMTFDFGNGYFASDSLAATTYNAPGVYSVTQMITNGCSYDTVSVSVEVFAQPEVILTSEESDLCVGEVGVFEANATSAGQIAWNFGSGFELGSVSETNAWNTSGFHWVTVEVTSALNACLVEDSLLIQVQDVPSIEVTSSNVIGCSPLEVDFINESSGVIFWQWDFGDESAGSTVAEPQHLFQNPSSDIQDYVVTVTGINAAGCSASQELMIQSLPSPEAAFALEDSMGCGSEIAIEPLNLSENSLSFIWSVDGLLASTEMNPLLTISGLGTHELGLEVENMFGCDASTTELFVLHAIPEAGLAVLPMMGCAPLEVDIEIMDAGAVESMLLITSQGDVIYEGPSETNWTLVNPGNYEFEILTTSAEGCQNSFAIADEVEVWPRPLVQFIADPYAGTWDSPDPLNSSWVFENYSEDGQAFWDFGDGGNSTEWNGTHTYQSAGTYEVTLTMFNEYGCPAEFSNVVVVKEHLEVYVPNAFTPPTDGFSDGINDGWKPVISDVELIDQYDLSIYNRNGQLIWHSEDPEEFWVGEASVDGMYFSTNEVYTWLLQIDSQALSGSSREWRGHVTLIR